MKTKTFEDFLKEKHAEQYTGLDDKMPDDFEEWLTELGVDSIKYADEYAAQQKQEMAEGIDNLILSWTDKYAKRIRFDVREDLEKLKQKLTK